MKKILLIGELNQIIGSLNKYLSTRFQTQMCVESQEMVKIMKDVFMPDMVLLLLTDSNQADGDMLDYLEEVFPGLPVLLVGTVSQCELYKEKYKRNKTDYLIRPTNLGMLLQKCELLLNMIEKSGADISLENGMQKSTAIWNENVGIQKSENAKKRVLAVDDSGIFLRSIKSMLEKQYEVTVANSGKTAIIQAKAKLPDVILLDYEMPEWDGRRTLEEIRQNDTLKEIPVVFLTAVSDKKHIAAVLELKPSGYLLKPIEPDRLLETLEEALTEI